MKAYYERYWDDKEELGDLNIKWPSVQRFFPENARGRLLDYGCGKGALLERIVRQQPELSVYKLGNQLQ